jgi:hypothetical protein
MTTTIPRTFDIVLNLIVASLAPAFLGITGSDIDLARMTALDTVGDYQARNNADLLTVGQIVAFSLASLASLKLSWNPDIAPSIVVRLRANAVSCGRASGQNRRARIKGNTEPAPPEAIEPLPIQYEPSPEPEFMTGQVDQLLATEAQHRLDNPAERPSAMPLVQIDPQTIDAKRHQEAWAITIAKESSAAHAAIPHLPPEQRPAATKRAENLSRAFYDLTYQGLLEPDELEAIIIRVCPDLAGELPPV